MPGLHLRLQVFALFTLGLALALPAHARDWRITRFDSNIVVAPNGTEEVTERIQLQFTGSFRGIYRDIPIEYAGPNMTIGFNAKYFLDVLSALDDDEVQLGLGGELDPAVVRPAGPRQFLAVVMPMRI